jgi:hypothetical protein
MVLRLSLVAKMRFLSVPSGGGTSPRVNRKDYRWRLMSRQESILPLSWVLKNDQYPITLIGAYISPQIKDR